MTIGKVYGLRKDGVMCYIGSTMETIASRLGRHRYKSRIYPHRRIYRIIANEWAEIEVVILDYLPDCTKEQLRRREQQFYEIYRPQGNMLCPMRI